MKVTYRISPGPQFEFLELESDIGDRVNPGDLAKTYWELHKAFAPQPINQKELQQKDWNRVLDSYLNGQAFQNGEHEQMSDRQKWMIHELDKAFSRIKSKDNQHG